MVSIADLAHFATQNTGFEKVNLQRLLPLLVSSISKSSWSVWGVDCYRGGRALQLSEIREGTTPRGEAQPSMFSFRPHCEPACCHSAETLP